MLRWTGSLALLLLFVWVPWAPLKGLTTSNGAAVVSPFRGAQRDAAIVLAEMRQALGGAAALDALKTFSVSGSRTLNTPMGSRRLSLEWHALLPDHFLEVRRDSPPGPIAIDIVYYSGLAGSRVIQKTDARGLNFPETRWADNSPAAVAAREQRALLRQTQAFARALLVFTGVAPAAYPLQFKYAGTEDVEGKSFDVIDAVGPDGFQCRLHADTTTHLPAMLSWSEELPVVMTQTTATTTTTTTTVRVPSGTAVPVTAPLPPPPPPSGSASPQPMGSRGHGTKRWLFKDFKTQDGITWPRKIEEEFDNQTEEIRLGQVKINPKIDAKKFDVK